MNNHIFSLNCDYTSNIITISSVDDYSCKIVDSIINCFFDNNAKLYFASGLPDNIDEIYEDKNSLILIIMQKILKSFSFADIRKYVLIYPKKKY